MYYFTLVTGARTLHTKFHLRHTRLNGHGNAPFVVIHDPDSRHRTFTTKLFDKSAAFILPANAFRSKRKSQVLAIQMNVRYF